MTFEYNELCGVYSYVLSSLELLWYHDLGLLNSSHKHDVVDEDEQEKRFEQFLLDGGIFRENIFAENGCWIVIDSMGQVLMLRLIFLLYFA